MVWIYRSSRHTACAAGALAFLDSGEIGRGALSGFLSLYGTRRELLFYDEVSFVLFPSTATRGLGICTPKTYFWPFFSRSTGEGIARARVFPLYGYSKKEGVYDHRFICWPFFTAVDMEEEPYGGLCSFHFMGKR